jgi:multiple sugar transport system ATP-binding protein
VTTVYVTHDQIEAMTLGHRVCVLRDGAVQQVDTPQDLFDHPVNLFVGGFIGSPSMNTVTARVVSGDDGLAVTFAGYQLAVPEAVVRANSSIEAYVGRDVIIGIRPSDFEDMSLTDDSWPRMPVVTHVIEKLGSEINVIFAIDAPPVEHKDLADLAAQGEEDEGAAIPLHEGKALWTARVNARSQIRAGGRIELGVDTRNLHFFDPGSGLAVGVRPAGESGP